MKTKHLFWGFLFITLGILILINNLSSVNIYWFSLWEYWPLFLILIGISLLIKQEIIKTIIVSLTAIILGVAIFSTLKTGWGFFSDEVIVNIRDRSHISDRDLETKFFEEEYNENLKNASLYLKASAGSYKIDGTTDLLFSATARSYKNNYKLTRFDEGESTKLHFENEDNGFFIFRGKAKNIVDISLNTNPVWKMNFDVGASASEFYLEPFKVEDLDIDIGAASLKVVLGDLLDSARVNIDAGASSVEISIPENVGCEIKDDVVLSSRHFEGFRKIESDLYRTENFNSSTKKIYIDIDVGVSSLTIKRYDKGIWF